MLNGPLSGIVSGAEQELYGLKGVTLRRVDRSGAVGATALISILTVARSGTATSEEAAEIKPGPIDGSVFNRPDGYATADLGAELRAQMQSAREQMGDLGFGQPQRPRR
jgi:hypothetical protein